MNRKYQIIIFFTWLIFLPPFLYYMFETMGQFWMDQAVPIISFMILMALVSLFPVKIKGTVFIPVHGVSLAVFLHFGLFTEVLLTQVAIFIVLFSMRLHPDERYRIPLNSLIFLCTSLLSGGAFFLVGGTVGVTSFETISNQIVPIITYTVTYFFTNNSIIYITRRFLQRHQKAQFFTEGLYWEGVTAMLILPIGVILAYLYQQIGIIALPVVGIPVVASSLILKIYHDGKEVINKLQRVSEFGHQVNRMTNSDDMYDHFLEVCYDILPADGALLFDPPDELEDQLTPVHIDSGMMRTDWFIKSGDAVSRRVLETGESIILRSGLDSINKGFRRIVPKTESVLSVPAVREGRITGVTTIISFKKNAFNRSHRMLLDIMLNHLTIAIQNGIHLERAKLEGMECGLTKLKNYRYFERTLKKRYTDNQKPFAIILMDLDHFKQVNDEYGHSAGNEVLYQVARVIEAQIPKKKGNVVARYGGEEFVVLLDNSQLSDARSQAEKIRKAVAKTLFQVTDDLKSGKKITINLTASIGVAARQKDPEDPLSILRNADRAMYTGAKQKGRDKVAAY